MTRYLNPANNHTQTLSWPVEFITCLVFGPVYFIYRRIWGHAILSLIMAVATSGLSWLIYPLFISTILEGHYLDRGWHKLA